MKVALANKPNEAFSTQNAPKKQIQVPADSDTEAAPAPPPPDPDTEAPAEKAPEPAFLEPGELRLPNDAPATPKQPVRQQPPAPIVRASPTPVERPKPVPVKKRPAVSSPPTR
jgi:hypothetical protein